MTRTFSVLVLSFLLVGSLRFPAMALQSVTLNWDASSDTYVAGYNVYYGPASGIYTNKVSVGSATSVTISGLVEGTTSYFAVTAYDTSGLESVPSNEVAYTVPAGTMLVVALDPANGPPSAFITASGSIPPQWVLEMSRDLRTWAPFAWGTNEPVHVPVAPDGTRARFFRLRGP